MSRAPTHGRAYSPLQLRCCGRRRNWSAVAGVKFIVRKHYYASTTNQLGYYLAGLIEGDGAIILRKGDREKTSKIVFTFHNNEIPVYEKLKSTLKSGVIYYENNGVCRYSITNADAVINVVNLINGKFRTPKIQALYAAIDNLNKWRGTSLLKLPLDTSSVDSNA